MYPNKLTPGYNIMWESSRMMLPEHKEQLLAKKRRKKEFQRPDLSEDQLQEMNDAILKSIEQDRAVTIVYAGTYGPKKFWGWVTHLWQHDQSLKIINDEDALTLSFHEILSAEIS